MMMNSLDTHALLTQGRQITLPAFMEVRLTASPENVETLELLQTFRLLPGRRMVALVRWKERLVVMKLFFSRRRWTTHLARETASIRQLVNAGLPTPALLGSGRCVDGRSGFMLLEYLDNGESVQLRWERSTGELRESLLRDVVTLIAAVTMPDCCRRICIWTTSCSRPALSNCWMRTPWKGMQTIQKA